MIADQSAAGSFALALRPKPLLPEIQLQIDHRRQA